MIALNFYSPSPTQNLILLEKHFTFHYKEIIIKLIQNSRATCWMDITGQDNLRESYIALTSPCEAGVSKNKLTFLITNRA